METRVIEWTENERKTREEIELAKQERLKLAAEQREEAEAKKAVSAKGCFFSCFRCHRYFITWSIQIFLIETTCTLLIGYVCLEALNMFEKFRIKPDNICTTLVTIVISTSKSLIGVANKILSWYLLTVSCTVTVR